MTKILSVTKLLRQAQTQLNGQSSSPRLDAELLLMKVLDFSRSQLFCRPQLQLTKKQLLVFHELLQRRLQQEPMAYILGECEFYSRIFHVDETVLVPRADTECLVTEVLTLLLANENCYIADLGTGSGAIAISVALERPQWHVFASDKFSDALICAKANAKRLVVSNINFVSGDWCQPLPANIKFHAILANPPYISSGDPHLQTMGVAREPRQALVAKEQGMADIRKVVIQAYDYLRPGGYLIIEHGYDQADKVIALMSQHHYDNIITKNDLANRSRMTVASVPQI